MLSVTTMAGYAISRKDYVLHKFFWLYFIATMFLSGGMIPGYLLIKSLGLFNTFWVYIVPGLFGGTFFMILVKTYVEQLPSALHDSAIIDGAGEGYFFFRIIVPLSTPIIATLGLFSAIGHWNSWYDTMFYNSSSPRLFTLQYNLMLLIDRYGENVTIEQMRELQAQGVQWIAPAGMRATLTFVTIIPIMCVYPLLQKYFTKGLLIGAIKA